MINAQVEFLEHVLGKDLLCAHITKELNYDECGSFLLKVNYSIQDYSDFLSQLNFVYNNGFGRQNLFGHIWYTDGTWSERGEYDGSEWWVFESCPDIPEICKA